MIDLQTAVIDARASLRYKKELLAAKFVGTPSAEVFDPAAPFTPENAVTLEKKPGQDFIILNITDPHFSDYDPSPEETDWDAAFRRTEAIPTTRMIRKLVRLVKPDLITVTGDMVCDTTRYSIDRFTALMDSFATPWAPVFGNHDQEGACDKNFLAERMMRSPTCLMRKGPANLGVGNYVIRITENGATVGALLMTDTSTPDIQSQAKWFPWAADGIRALAGGEMPIAVFGHKPHEKFRPAFDAVWNEETKKFTDPDAVGVRGEEECPWGNDQYDAIREAGIRYDFCGHDHLNDYSVTFEGMHLVYALKTGKGSGYHPDQMGGTIITLNGDGTFHARHQFIDGQNDPTLDLF